MKFFNFVRNQSTHVNATTTTIVDKKLVPAIVLTLESIDRDTRSLQALSHSFFQVITQIFFKLLKDVDTSKVHCWIKSIERWRNEEKNIITVGLRLFSAILLYSQLFDLSVLLLIFCQFSY